MKGDTIMHNIKNNLKLESLIERKFATVENTLGLGKIINIEETGESIITNGKALITFSETDLQEQSNVTEDERFRIKALTDTLIHKNYGDLILCELYFSLDEVKDIINFLGENIANTIEVIYHQELETILFKNKNTETTLVKPLRQTQINSFKSLSGSVTVEALQLHNTLQLVSINMTKDDVLGIAIQHNNKPLMIETNKIKGCLTAVKEN